MTLHVPFDNSYGRLPDRFYSRLAPTPVSEPGLIQVNDALAAELGLDPQALRSPEGVAALAGNAVPDGADPLAQVYAGHQFGGWNPQLGDGRAILLGEVIDTNGVRRDLQLKGAGPTPYSRMGDGRAWLGPVLREYIVSEAMHALGIPTTRALAAVTTGDPVIRNGALPGAVLTRVASSHVRVGTFQYFAARGDLEALQALTDYVIERHYPEAGDALGLLNAVTARQARLVAQWLGVGFIHGVMNTDNSSVAGETIDYGPCAFMDAYHPGKVFSSIDQYGRYAYAKQPEIAVWNMAQLATAILPLIDPDQNTAIEKATEAVNRFPDIYQDAWIATFGAKLGLADATAEDVPLIEALLTLMTEQGADFTRTFRGLSEDSARAEFSDPSGFDDWATRWAARRPSDWQDRARAANPAVIARNHRVEQAISAAVAGDYAPFLTLNEALATPFRLSPDHAHLAEAPGPEEEVRQTFCGT
ncbi:protein adenylyltransferase SelO [Psychromarinibacter halotolerans]|uniref:Protein nucleotidyltransferase YdiU n=1 Tax=Psychromarinibacter halotolerans TaxID=1775175 RepID=A0ABV7GV25_9RHOB|nr:YdiU family protein [Psychromarinibacter halotolerans]MDF0595141.1 YdiU family protein [Psychromarinibacter halotolerans]